MNMGMAMAQGCLDPYSIGILDRRTGFTGRTWTTLKS